MGQDTYLEFLQKLVNNKYEQRELNYFIEDLFKISLTYVRYSHYRIKKIIDKESLTIEDVSIEAIVPLFLIGKVKKNFVITEKFNDWQPKIESEEEALFFLNKIIAKRVEQYISSLFRQSDPFFSHILDAVNYLIRTQNLVKTYYLGKVYVTENDAVFSGEIIENENLKKIPSVIFNDKKDLIVNILNYLKSDTDYFPAVPLNELVLRLKHLNFSGFKKNDSSLEKIIELEINEIVNNGLNLTLDKLKISYLETKKLSEKEYIVFKKALFDMTDDLKDGGVNPGLYKYLRKYWPNLHMDEYKNRYHNIIEYLLKTLKENVAEELSAN